MATYVNDLRLKEIATGDESGTWGTSTNTNLELIAEAFSFGTEGITTNADTHTTTIADGSTDPGRSIYLKYTGTLDSACTITIGPNTVSKLWFIENGTSGSQNIIISQGSGANVTIPPGDVKAVYSDGAGSGAAIVDAFASLNVVDLKVEDDLTLSSDSAVITFGADGDTTLTHTDGTGLTLNSTNKLCFNDASQFIQGSSATVLSLGATDEIDLTATAIDINGNADISGTLGVTGAVTADAGVSIDNITIDGTEIDLSSGDLTIDVAGDIILDADGADIIFKDGGTQFGKISKGGGSDLVIDASIADKDIFFTGTDGSSLISALTLDMSDAGTATFNSNVNVGGIGHVSLSGAASEVSVGVSGDTDNSGGGVSFAHNTSTLNSYVLGQKASMTIGSAISTPLLFVTNNTERMRIASDGTVGIGETSPDSILHIKNSASDSVAGISLENDARRYAINVHGGLSDGLAIFNAGAGETQFFIASGGNVGIGADNTSPDSVLSVKDATSDPIVTVHKNSTGVSDALRVQHGRGLSGFSGKGISFRRNDGTEVGGVVIGFSSTTYNTSSDYRLKENVTYTWDATTRLKQLKPARFTFKDDTSDLVDGFIAHEVSSIVPEAVTGEKDAVDSEGNPEYQGIDQSKLVPLLVKTIQELEARITALES